MSDPTLKNEVHALFTKASGGNREAYLFLVAFGAYIEEVRDFLSSSKEPQEFIRLLANTATIYTLPFYNRNAAMLQVTVTEVLAGVLEGHTVKTGEPWMVNWAEYAGLGMDKIVMAVAMISIGFEKASELRPMVKELAWATR